jgi:hypothetical protein
MKNLLLNIGNTGAGFTILNSQQVIPNELLDQAIKLLTAILTAVLSNWLINKANEKSKNKKLQKEEIEEIEKKED